MKTLERLTDEHINALGHAVIDYFDEYASSDHFGWDWRTMWLVHPLKCSLFHRLKVEWQRRRKVRELFKELEVHELLQQMTEEVIKQRLGQLGVHPLDPPHWL